MEGQGFQIGCHLKTGLVGGQKSRKIPENHLPGLERHVFIYLFIYLFINLFIYFFIYDLLDRPVRGAPIAVFGPGCLIQITDIMKPEGRVII
jgi:hypothetical protein